MKRILIFALFFLVACGSETEPKGVGESVGVAADDTPAAERPEAAELMQAVTQARATTTDELLQNRDPALQDSVSYDPSQAANLQLIQDSPLGLTPAELEAMTSNGFVVASSSEFPSFVYGYEAIYANDLPIYISADSILHAIHRSFSDILQYVESEILTKKLVRLLTSMRSELAAGAASEWGSAVENELDFYLSVGLSLLQGTIAQPVAGASSSDVAEFVQLAEAAEGDTSVRLFGFDRAIDTSQFDPRGHYTDSEELERYFRAMIWFGRIDLRILEVDGATGERLFHRQQLEIALAMRAVMDDEALERWSAVDSVITSFVGEHDSMIVPELDELVDNLGVTDPIDIRDVSDAEIVNVLDKHGLGQQRIASHLVVNGIDGTLPLNTSFLLFGQRYTIDSHVFSNVVYDRVNNGATLRMMPDPLDVAFAAFGNDQASQLLEPQLREYEYAGDLEAMRILADNHGEDFWRANLYNHWMSAIRGMSPTEASESWDVVGRPEVTSTDAWGRRVLNSQLASWAELRHDTLLYVKQSYTSGNACEFPDAYVDPYPETYASLTRFARAGEDALVSAGLSSNDAAVTYFRQVADVTELLRELAEKQRRGEPYSDSDMEFINSTVKIQWGCGDPAGLDGWYARLFFRPVEGIEYDPTIADVHTQYTDEGGTVVGNVLHVATGRPNLMAVTVDTCRGPRAYVGLVSSYYEQVERDFVRLDDDEWSVQLDESPPPRPEWLAPAIR